MSNLNSLTKAELIALLGRVSESAPTAGPIGTGDQFASLGFVAVGNGQDPGEGSLIDVPTKAGNVKRVRTIQAIDPGTFGLKFAWAYTYKAEKA